MPFPSEWIEYPDGSWGPPETRMPRSTSSPDSSPESAEFRSRPTDYLGNHFRSRSEARWAVIFNFLGLKFEYEPRAYNLGGIGYLPDFWMPTLRCFIEIKGPHPTPGEKVKARGLARVTQRPVYIFFCGIPIYGPDGAPRDFECGEDAKAHGYQYTPEGEENLGYAFGVKECCGALGIVYDAYTPRIFCDCGVDPEWDASFLMTLQMAFLRGRNAKWN